MHHLARPSPALPHEVLQVHPGLWGGAFRALSTGVVPAPDEQHVSLPMQGFQLCWEVGGLGVGVNFERWGVGAAFHTVERAAPGEPQASSLGDYLPLTHPPEHRAGSGRWLATAADQLKHKSNASRKVPEPGEVCHLGCALHQADEVGGVVGTVVLALLVAALQSTSVCIITVYKTARQQASSLLLHFCSSWDFDEGLNHSLQNCCHMLMSNICKARRRKGVPPSSLWR